jgi:hypothetical protein
MINDFHVTWFDGGGTAGWAHACLSREAFSRPEHKILSNIRWWDCGEFTGPESDILKSAVTWIDSVLVETSFLSYHVGGEDFDLVQTIGDKQNVLSPVRQNAVLWWECAKRGIDFKYQNRSLRTNVTPKRLSRFGFEGRWTTSGKGKDQFAAMQHLIVYLRRLKEESRSRPWKLNEGDIQGAYWDCACVEGYKCDLTHPN